MKFKLLTLGIIVPVALSGCMSPGTGSSGTDEFQAPQRLAGLYNATRDETITKVLPTSGSATYSGAAGLNIADGPGSDVMDVLLADAEMTAVFDASGATIDGSMTNWHGQKAIAIPAEWTNILNLADLDLGDWNPATGSVNFTGTITGTNESDISVSGEVIYDGTTYAVDGPVLAGFAGANADYFAINGGEDTDAAHTPDFTADGVSQSGVIYVLVGK